jgi:putative nucleotidyltransferase with HDIG domain
MKQRFRFLKAVTSIFKSKTRKGEAPVDDSVRLERMRHIAQRVNNIPTLSVLVHKVIELVENPNTSVQQLAEFLSKDQSLTAKILKLANSAFYGFPQKIGTINLAIVVLGFESVKDLGLSSAVVEAFQEEIYGDHMDLNKFWIHSVAVAAGCKIMTHEVGKSVGGEIFVAGLLHDIGKMVTCRHMTEEFDRIKKTSLDSKRDMAEVELEILGFSHADVGGWLAEKWNLPAHQTNAIYYHPFPWLSFKEPNIAMHVHFADLLAHKAGYDAGFPKPLEGVHPRVVSYLNVKCVAENEVDWDYYLGRLNVEMENAKGFLSLLTSK